MARAAIMYLRKNLCFAGAPTELFHPKETTFPMNFLQKLMYGRYGLDPLSIALMLLYLLLSLLSYLPHMWLLGYLSLVLWAVVIFRMLSRNLPKRRAENAKFMQLAGPLLRWVRTRRTMRKDKDHCYFKCPNCGQHLRVPKGKGKITVTCRSCGVSFEEKS